MTQYAFFIWDGKPHNMVKVCLESLRNYNQECVILFYYSHPDIITQFSHLNIRFREIDTMRWQNRRMFHKIELVRELIAGFHPGDQLLVLDCDLLFQGNPFKMFKFCPGNDLYYTTSLFGNIISEKWNKILDPVNGGVWGLTVNNKTIQLLDFWMNNMINPTWNRWMTHLKSKLDMKVKNQLIPTLDWWMDQLFLNCLHFAEPNEIPIKGFQKIDLGYHFNFFLNLPILKVEGKKNGGDISHITNMNIGNPNVFVIHFKGKLKYIYQTSDPEKYNLAFLTDKEKVQEYYTSPEFMTHIKKYLESD